MMLIPFTGCTSWAPSMPDWGNTQITRKSSPAPKMPIGSSDLSTEESAQLCLKTAEQMTQGGDLLGAVTFYEQARRLDPTATNYSRVLASLYDQLDSKDLAQNEYRKAIEQAPTDADLCNDFGVFYLRREQWADSEVWFRKSLTVQPQHERATTNLAISLGMQNQLKESFDLFHRSAGAAAANSNLGVLLARQGRSDEARHHFQQALALDPSLSSAKSQLALLAAPQNHPVSQAQFSTK